MKVFSYMYVYITFLSDTVCVYNVNKAEYYESV